MARLSPQLNYAQMPFPSHVPLGSNDVLQGVPAVASWEAHLPDTQAPSTHPPMLLNGEQSELLLHEKDAGLGSARCHHRHDNGQACRDGQFLQ